MHPCPIPPGPAPARRRLLRGAAGLAAFGPGVAAAIGRHGRVEPPDPAPEVALLRDDGARTTLPRMLAGRTTAMHFMFTGCRATCPIQGAVFARVQAEIAPRRLPRVQLLSISVDALGDTPASLARWLKGLSAGDAWRAAVPVPSQADRLLQWAGGNQPFAADSHTAQVLLFDDRARLVMRTTDLPDPAEVVRLLVELDARAGRG